MSWESGVFVGADVDGVIDNPRVAIKIGLRLAASRDGSSRENWRTGLQMEVVTEQIGEQWVYRQVTTSTGLIRTLAGVGRSPEENTSLLVNAAALES